MVRIQNGTISVGSPRGMWKHLLTLYMQISLDSIILFLEPNPKSSWTKIQNDSFKGLYTVMLLVQVKDRNKWNVHWVGNDWINDSQNRILRNWENAYRSALCTNMKKYTKNRLLSENKVEYWMSHATLVLENIDYIHIFSYFLLRETKVIN